MKEHPGTTTRIVVTDVGDVAVVKFADGRIFDEQNIQMIGDDLYRLVTALKRTKVLLDFGAITYTSSSAFGKFVAVHGMCRDARGKLVLTGVCQSDMDSFVKCELDGVLNFAPDRAQGLQQFAA